MKGKGKTRAEFLICFVLFLLVFLVYHSIPNFEFNNFDDLLYVVDNINVQRGLTLSGFCWAFTSFSASNWHPITWLSHMLDCTMFGMNPGGHFFTNLLLHALNSILLFIIFLKMTGAKWRSAFVAALFAVHPLHVESVAWISERKDLLSALFAFLTIWAYWSYTVESRKKFYWAAIFFFAVGLMSKPMLVTLPFVLILLDYWPLHRLERRINLKEFRDQCLEKYPFFALSLASSGLTIMAQQKAMSSMQEFPLDVRLGNALTSYVRYLEKTFWPVDLAYFYPIPEFMEIGTVVICAAAIIGLSLVAVRLSGKAPYLPVGWFWYLGMLVPVIGIVQVGSQSMADRYTYIPLIGIFIAVVWGAEAVSKSFRYGKVMTFSCGVAVVILLALMANLQTSHWKNSKEIYTHAIRIMPDNHVAHNNLGVTYTNVRDFGRAEFHFQQALRIYPDYSRAIYNFALLNELQNRLDESIAGFRKFLETEKETDSILVTRAHLKHSMALLKKGKVEEAESVIRKFVSAHPENAAAHNIYGVILVHQMKVAEAQKQFEEAVSLEPDNTNYAKNLHKLRKE